ncbi:GGDEF domain-containing protein [Desulfosudis oleivorans]|uniref:diguanylate cyclase n=1 Tax=Desulfosudis oleivorans (strain DSM 6200 / JCM 39069 / Hxd3) TaxID=96561 RepID=A9A077_DESOH|nr:diguanylate cyclase [Desulfosudis oleivorans]ABW68996.1 diguanylate cyclase [Desulfosudis oleivorans Hxd3]
MKTIGLPKLADFKDRFLDRFFGLTIATRMTLAYLPLAIIIVLISVYTLSSLSELGDISRSIVTGDMVVIEATDSLTQNLLAQEAYGRRYLIMKSDEMKELFQTRSTEIDNTLDTLARVDEMDLSLIRSLKARHDDFTALYAGIFDLPEKELATAGAVYDDRIRQGLDDQLAIIKAMTQEAREGLAQKSRRTDAASMRAFHVAALLSALGICLGIGSAYIITRSMSRSIAQLKLATAKFSERQFDFVPDLRQKDEFGMLARAFIAMAQRLARLEVMDLDASPLTRLPGGVAIENVLETRLAQQQDIAFCLVDIDNFKAFNDRYGYARGNEVIKATGKILESAIADHGTEDAFVGHIGGDDFAVILHPDRYGQVCQAIIEAFDRKSPTFYDPEDRDRGYVIAKTRQGKQEQFPLMTVSIAVVTNLSQKEINSVRIGEVAAELKEYAKTVPGSLFLVDRREHPSA